MPFYFSSSVDMGEAARQLSNDLRMTLDLLVELAAVCPTIEEAEAFGELLADEHTGSVAHRTVAPPDRDLRPLNRQGGQRRGLCCPRPALRWRTPVAARASGKPRFDDAVWSGWDAGNRVNLSHGVNGGSAAPRRIGRA